MRKIREIASKVTQQNGVRILAGFALFVWILSSQSSASVKPLPLYSAGNDDVAALIFQSVEPRDGFLVVKYNVNFPGVTKIRMYNDNLQFLWRGQFLDTEKGDQEIYLRMDRLTSGETYFFELEYKAKIQYFSYRVP
jgi:hypothetical protein